MSHNKKIIIACLVAANLFAFTSSAGREIINNKPQLAERRKNYLLFFCIFYYLVDVFCRFNLNDQIM